MADATIRRERVPARDPRAVARFAAADELRLRGQHAAALHAALDALAEHPYDADGHHLLARIYAGAGDAVRARDEWETALRLDPAHAGARSGLATMAAQGGQAPAFEDEDTLPRGVRTVTDAGPAGAGPETGTPARAAATHPGMLSFPDPRVIAALLTDRDGMVVAQHAASGVSDEACQALGAILSSLAAETPQVLTALGMGRLRTLRVECASGALALAPVPDDHLVVVAVQQGTPLGLARRYLTAAQRHAQSVLEDA
jgi:predicted regulator of Ras-like GTPase activity (Roadblock/LC7/MglB family)